MNSMNESILHFGKNRESTTSNEIKALQEIFVLVLKPSLFKPFQRPKVANFNPFLMQSKRFFQNATVYLLFTRKIVIGSWI